MMNKLFCFILLITCECLHAQQRTVSIDNDWSFYRGELNGAQYPAFNDASWRVVDLPHDWSIEDLPGRNSPFSRDAVSGVSGGFTTGGTGWYRKKIAAPKKGKHVYIQFDGIYMNADVWINGDSLGNHPYGYTSFGYDITDKIKPGDKNVLAVRVRNDGKNSRWYSGSGIYRHVWLTVTGPLHVAQWGTFITTPQVSSSSATINIKTELRNNGVPSLPTKIVTRIIDPKGNLVIRLSHETFSKGGAPLKFNQSARITKPSLWSTESPSLYTAVTDVYNGKKLTDTYKTIFGIRSISFDAVNGFRLNGKTLKLKGGCVHHDNGPLGSKAYDRAEERRVQLLKASGFNAIRTSHNPPSPAFLDACDREGMLVIDEAFDMWRDKKNKDDYHLYFDKWWQRDLESMLLRDRNHPSIIMWSTGNEIPKRDLPEVVTVAKMLADHIRSIDTTRPVTCGVNGVEANKDPFFATLDVGGYNYARDKYESEHDRHPERVVYAAESFAIEAFEYWREVQKHPYVIGDFVWTAFDHIGEASIGWLGYKQSKDFYPWNLAWCGDIDICGWKRPQSYYRDALWKENQLSLFVKPVDSTFKESNPRPESWSKWNWHDAVADWNWHGNENKLIEVTAYSSCEETELFLNGKSLGKKVTDSSAKFMGVWQVPYQPGSLKAVGYTNGKQVNNTVLRTVKEPVLIKLSSDRTIIKADNQDLVYVTVELTDSTYLRHPKAENLIRFNIEGDGTIAGVGNANPKSIESNQLPQRKAWQGRCLVIIKAGKKAGKITLTASADGFEPAKITITSSSSMVSDTIMRQVYEEVKTPFKYGMVLSPKDDSKKMDCPTVFRNGNDWYMSYFVFDGRGYETWLAKSTDLLNWKPLGKLLSFSDTTDWDNNQKGGYIALENNTWGGPYNVEKYNGKYWMSYFGGATRGYEAGDLSIGMAYTTADITTPHEWQRLKNPVLTSKDKDTRWWENKKQFKSSVLWDKDKTTGHPFLMYYNANGDSAKNNIRTRWFERIGMAVSDDMVNWKRFKQDPVMHHPVGITGDAVIQKIGKLWVMFYFGAFWEGRKDAFNRFACSYDLVNWTDWEGPDLINSSEPYDEKFAHKSFVLKHNGIVYHFYNAVNNKDQRGIALATSTDLRKKY